MIAVRQMATAPQKYVEPSAVERMAQAMAEIAFAGQTCDADALALKGFTRAEIDRHGRDAADLATQRAIRRVA